MAHLVAPPFPSRSPVLPAAGSAPDWFASVNPDMSIKVWNVATGKHHVTLKEPQHLAKNYTCIAFVNGVSSKVRR